jgi:hypothetical protein
MLRALGGEVDVGAQHARHAAQRALVQPQAGRAADTVEDQRRLAHVLGRRGDELALRLRIVVDGDGRQRLWAHAGRLARFVVLLEAAGDDRARATASQPAQQNARARRRARPPGGGRLEHRQPAVEAGAQATVMRLPPPSPSSAA